MGNSITFRLNPKHAEDRAIIEWLDANAGTAIIFNLSILWLMLILMIGTLIIRTI